MNAAVEGMGGGDAGGAGQPAQRYVFDNFAIGIDRTRNASPPRDGALYDLVNCYLTPGHTLKRRPGFQLTRALAACYGLCSYAGKLHTFYSGADPGSDAIVATHKLVCPDGSGSALAKVHYAKPLYGYLYVVAEFANATVWHMYLDDGSDQRPHWTAGTHYSPGTVVSPTVPNGLHYLSLPDNVDPKWKAGVKKVLNNYVQPTIPNGFRYKATAITIGVGSTAAYTGDDEPVWPTTVGHTVIDAPVAPGIKTWKAGMGVTRNERIQPAAMVDSGLQFQCMTNSQTGDHVNHTGDSQPDWAAVALGGTIADGDVVWKCVQGTIITWTCQDDNTSAGVEPVWPLVPGATIADGTASWKAIGMNVSDTSCPSTKAAIILSGKVWALDSTGHNVRFCAAANPRAWTDTAGGEWAASKNFTVKSGVVIADSNGNAQKVVNGGRSGKDEPLWSTVVGQTTVDGGVIWKCVGIAAPQDAGFLPFSLDAGEDTSGTALGSYQGNLVVHSASGFELWQVDPDPSQCVLLEGFEGRGSVFTRGNASMGTDSLYLTTFGVRSLSQVLASSSLQAGDAGVTIDALVAPNVSSADTFTPIAFNVAALGQLWLCNGNTIYAYTNMQDVQIQGWSRYTLPWNVKYLASKYGVVYVLADDGNLYSFDTGGNYYQDDNGAAHVLFTTSIIWPYMVLGRHTMFQPEATAAYAKFIKGINVIASAVCQFQGGYDEANLANLTPAMNVGPDDRPQGINPVEVMCMSFSPQISYAGNTPFEFSSMIVWYDVLGAAVG